MGDHRWPKSHSVQTNWGKQEGGPGRTKIFQAIKEGKLRAYKDGKRTIILAHDYIAYIQSLPLAGPHTQPRWREGRLKQNAARVRGGACILRRRVAGPVLSKPTALSGSTPVRSTTGYIINHQEHGR